jgi:hypothetical protein
VGERQLEGVEHGQEPEDECLAGAAFELGLLALGALAEVVEVGLQALQGVEELVPLAADACEVVGQE